MAQFKTVASDWVCLECGNVFTIPRKMQALRGDGHIKDLYCYSCRKVTKHYEVKDVSVFLWRYCGQENLDDYTRKVIDFLMKRDGQHESDTESRSEKRVHKKILIKG